MKGKRHDVLRSYYDVFGRKSRWRAELTKLVGTKRLEASAMQPYRVTRADVLFHSGATFAEGGV